MSLKVTELAIYPVKSLRGKSLQTMSIDPLGPVGDRRFMVTDVNGLFLTQRQHSRMCLIDAALVENTLQLSAPDMPLLRIEPTAAFEISNRVTVWRDVVEALDMGADAAAWLSRYLGVDARLQYMPDNCRRPIDPLYGQPGDYVSFADGFPILLITEASMRAFNNVLPQPIGTDRFRPNIVIDGDIPYAEDNWRRLRIGKLEFDIVKPCSRCVIPSIDPLTGMKQSCVVQALAKTRRRGDAVYFGQNLIHRDIGVINVGDTVTVLA